MIGRRGLLKNGLLATLAAPLLGMRGAVPPLPPAGNGLEWASLGRAFGAEGALPAPGDVVTKIVAPEIMAARRELNRFERHGYSVQWIEGLHLPPATKHRMLRKEAEAYYKRRGWLESLAWGREFDEADYDD